MNKKILKILNKYPNITQRRIAEKLNISLGGVNNLIKNLEKESLIKKDKGYFLTEKGLEKLNEIEIKDAVILAAGISKDYNRPNGFIEFENEFIVERSIKILLEIGIEQIYIVVGFEKEYYKKLQKKYKQIILLENKYFKEKSSYFSLKLLENILFKDFLLLDSDIIYEKKVLKKLLNTEEKNIIVISSETGSKDECFVELKNDYIEKMSKDKSELKQINGEMLGISKLSYEYFQEIIKLEVKNNYYSYEYAIGETSKKIPLKALKLNELIWGEIDNNFQYERVLKEVYPRLKRNESLEQLEEIKNLLISILDIQRVDIDEIEVLGGMTNKNYLVIINNKKYVLRIPGIGTTDIINRYSEKINAIEAAKLHIDKELIYFNSDTGIKISEYIEQAETLNPETSKKIENMILTSNILSKLHNSKIKFENKFDVFKEIEKYEELIFEKELLNKKYPNYLEVRKKIFNLKNILINNGYKVVPCHNDTVPENFIKDYKDDIYLIDWEYSGMNDPMWDLAAHSLECNFSETDEKVFLNNYFKGKIEKKNKLRIEIYKVLQDFLWSIWTILKEEKGDNFGTYGIDRYLRGKKRLEEILKGEI